MSPYESAFLAYHSQGPPAVPWPEVIARHLCHGVVISTSIAFLAARAVPYAAPDSVHQDLRPPGFPPSLYSAPDCWHIWIAAGDLRSLLRLQILHPLPWVSFCRRGETAVRRYPIASIFRHVAQSQNPAHATAGPAAGLSLRT
jgi:hypothetical protein